MRVSRLVLPVMACVVMVTGCTHVVAGTAKPGDVTAPDGQSSAGLGSMLLGVKEINTVMGADAIEVAETFEDMTDHSAEISDVACLGALYNAEEVVYQNSGWTDVADQVLTEVTAEAGHWVEQSVVAFASGDDASKFYETSKNNWQDCLGQNVSVFDQDYEFLWEFDGFTVDDTTITNSAFQVDGAGWTCEHSLRAVSDFVVEASTCGMALDEESVEIVEALANNVG
jgi:PknH-like extracellular domain